MKTKKTREMETAIWMATARQGVYGCFEVTIGLGWTGDSRVDYMTYDVAGTFRCYEIKSSKADFRSKNKNSFVGHLNYYVMPHGLYEEVREELPPHVGAYTDGIHGAGMRCAKKAKRQVLPEGMADTLKDSMIRSLCRDAEKLLMSDEQALIDRYKREAYEGRRQLESLGREVLTRYGAAWDADPVRYDEHGEEL